MNKRLFVIYTVVFLLIGLMLYLYRTSYNAMRVYIRDVHTITRVIVRLERLDALLHSWINNDSRKTDGHDLYMPSHVAYDSILAGIDKLNGLVLYQEQRLRLDSIKRLVKTYQRMDEKSDTVLTTPQRDEFRGKIKKILKGASVFANGKLQDREESLKDATALLDRWLVWMLVLAGSLMTVATFYSFSFLHQRRRAQSFSQTVLETTNYGIISFRPLYLTGGITDYEVTYCNEAALKLLHLPGWKDKTLSAIIPQGIRNDVFNAFHHVVQNKTSRTLEGYLDAASERNWLYVTIAPLEDGVLVSMYNLNPIKAYEQKLTYKIKQLELANDELQQYAYITSHDLQEPLRKIQMFSDMAMNQKGLREKGPDVYFNKIMNSATHMRELIQTLLMFTRSTDQPSDFVDVNLNDVLKQVLGDLDVLIAEKDASVVACNLPTIKASRVHVTLLFNNLITNSLKYSKPKEKPVIQIVSDPVPTNEYDRFPSLDPMIRYTHISIHDNGVGFDQSLSDKMFTIFQRLHPHEEVPGAGIGLAICRKIVHQHHGFIYAEGKENEGATFHIFLPFEQPQHLD
jgi:signal transduction histidine kinase